MIATTTIGAAGAMAATGFCLGAGIWAFHWVREMANRAIAWVKTKFKNIKDILIEKIRNTCDNLIINMVDKYPDLNWTQKAQMKIAEIFCRLIYKTNHEQFITFITQIKNKVEEDKKNVKVENQSVEAPVDYKTDDYGLVI